MFGSVPSLVLKRSRLCTVVLDRQRIESNTVVHTSSRHISILQSLDTSKDLPWTLSTDRTG